MRIMFLCLNYIPKQGGVEIATSLIASELSSRGHSIAIVTSMEDNSVKYEADENIRIFRFPVNKYLIPPWKGYYFIRRYLSDIQKIAKDEKIDVINIIHYNAVSSWAYQLKDKFEVPIIITVHTLLSADNRSLSWRFSVIEPFRRLLCLYPILWFEKRSLCSSNYLIAISNGLYNRCKKIRDDNNVELIPNAINFGQFNTEIGPKSIDCGNAFKILCSGRFSPEKGQIYLVKAIAEVSKSIPVHLFLLGGGTEKYRQQLEFEVKRTGIENIVHFMKPIPYTEVPTLYKSMDLIVQPSLSETFGIAILENMSLGNVVIASSVGGIPELIDDRINGLLVPPANPDILTDKIIMALTDTELRELIKRNAPIKASNFSISAITNRYESLLSNLME
jgi:glycosyltransferase involved in cell wall biosynthesis